MANAALRGAQLLAPPPEGAPSPQGPAPDMARIKRNVAKMVAKNAPVEDIDGYIASEGVTIDDVRNFKFNSIAEDIARSGATGARQGVESMMGLGGDLGNLASFGANQAAEYVGAPSLPSSIGKVMGGAFSGALGLPFTGSTEEIQAKTKEVIGDHYQPQTIAGEYARTTGQFLPAALSPGSALQRTAQVVVPAFMSETAGQITKGTPYEPYARAVAGITGGVLTAGNSAKQIVKDFGKNAPSGMDLKQHTDALFGALRKAGIEYDATAFKNMADDLPNVLQKANVRPVGKLKEAFDWADEVGKLSGKAPDFDDIQSLRASIGEAARDAARSPDGKSLARALDILKDKIDDFESSAPLTTTAPVARETLDKVRVVARQVAFRNIKQRVLDDILMDADTYRAGREAGIRNGIGTLLRSERGKQMFSKAERAALLDVANGRKGWQTLSRFGLDLRKVSGNATFLPTMGAGLTAAGGGVIPAVGLLGAGTAAKFISPALTDRAMETAAGAIRSGRLAAPGADDILQALEAARRARIGVTAGTSIQSANSPVR